MSDTPIVDSWDLYDSNGYLLRDRLLNQVEKRMEYCLANNARQLERDLAARDARIAELEADFDTEQVTIRALRDRIAELVNESNTKIVALETERGEACERAGNLSVELANAKMRIAELEHINIAKFTVSLICPTQGDPFNRVDCEVVDVSFSDKAITVECALTKRIAVLERALRLACADVANEFSTDENKEMANYLKEAGCLPETAKENKQ